MEQYFSLPLMAVLEFTKTPEANRLHDIFTFVTESIDSGINSAVAAGHDVRVVDSARFAVCALVDELMLQSALQPSWTNHTLQSHYYGTNCAGEAFYLRLNKLIEAPDESITIYYLSLAIGFKGKYLLTNSEYYLVNLIASLEKVLQEFYKSKTSVVRTDKESAGGYD